MGHDNLSLDGLRADMEKLAQKTELLRPPYMPERFRIEMKTYFTKYASAMTRAVGLERARELCRERVDMIARALREGVDAGLEDGQFPVECCLRCVYYIQPEPSSDLHRGQCRRNPPPSVQVFAMDYCGEYRKKET